MSQYIHLIGAEQVERAGNKMIEAAREMQATANMIEDSLQRHRNFMETWLQMFQEAMEKKP